LSYFVGIERIGGDRRLVERGIMERNAVTETRGPHSTSGFAGYIGMEGGRPFRLAETLHKQGNLREGIEEGSVEIPTCVLSVVRGVGCGADAWLHSALCTESAISPAENSCSLFLAGILETQHAYIVSAKLGQ